MFSELPRLIRTLIYFLYFLFLLRLSFSQGVRYQIVSLIIGFRVFLIATFHSDCYVIYIFFSLCRFFFFFFFLRRIQAMEMRCYRKIKRISYKDHVTSEGVRAKIQHGPHEDLLTIIKRRKLQWYGRASRSSGLAKTILQGTVKGGRRQGTERKRWKDNIREWIGLEFAKSQRAVENIEKWSKLVVKSSMAPQRPSL